MTGQYKAAGMFCALVVAVASIGCHGGEAPNPPATQPAAKQVATNQVSIDNFSFTPAELTITVGGTVTWINHDDVPHTVVGSVPNQWIKSDAMDTDQTSSHTFTTPGTYEYFCSIHPHMIGKIIVK